MIGDQSRGNNKQSGKLQIHERAEKSVEGMGDDSPLIFSSIQGKNL